MTCWHLEAGWLQSLYYRQFNYHMAQTSTRSPCTCDSWSRQRDAPQPQQLHVLSATLQQPNPDALPSQPVPQALLSKSTSERPLPMVKLQNLETQTFGELPVTDGTIRGAPHSHAALHVGGQDLGGRGMPSHGQDLCCMPFQGNAPHQALHALAGFQQP